MVFTKEELEKSVVDALVKLKAQGMPQSHIERMVKAAHPLGDLEELGKDLSYDEFQEFFTESRKHGIDGSVDYPFGGSTVPAILGISPYVTPLDVYMEKLDLPRDEKEDKDKEDIFYAGHLMEPIYRAYFRRQNAERYVVFDHDVQWNSRKYPHFIADVDGLILDKETGELGIYECKHTSYRNITMINRFRDNDVPEYYEAQGRAYMEALDADFVCFNLGWGNRPTFDDMAVVRIERDKSKGAAIMEECENFIEDNVIAMVPPTYRSIKDVDLARAKMAEIFGPVDRMSGPADLPDDLKAFIPKLVEAKEKLDSFKKELRAKEKEAEALEKAYQDLQNPFIEALAEHPAGRITVGDFTYEITYDTRATVDVKRLMEEAPEVYEAVMKPAIYTEKLKKSYAEYYNKYRWKDPAGNRSFGLRSWKSKKSDE